jgi:hypothetical protein
MNLKAHIRGKATVSAKPDFMATAATVVSKAIGENLFDGSPLPDPNAGKDPKAIERGKAGGLKGGKARAAKLSPKKRSQIAKIAAKARWQEK